MDRKSAKYKEQFIQDLVKIDINIDSDFDCDTPVVLTNYIYYRLQQLFSQPCERRVKMLQLLGVSRFASDAEVLPLKLIYKFDQNFTKLRNAARKNTLLDSFDKQVIDLSLESIPVSEVEMQEQEPEDEPPKKKNRLSNPKDSILSTKLRNTQNLLSYYKNTSKKLREALKDKGADNFADDYDELFEICEEQNSNISSLKEKITKLEQDVRDRDLIIDELNKNLKKPVNKTCIDLKDKGRFTVSAVACFGQLITQCSVAHHKVALTIQTVAELLKVKVVSLPSRWTVDRSLNFVNGLNSEQIVKVLSGCSNKALLSDETKKYTKQIDAFAVAGKNDETDESFMLFIGGGRVPDKSAFRMFKELENILGQIAQICNIDKQTFWDNFILSTKSMVSDEASTQKLLVKIYAEYKKTILSKLTSLDEATKAKLEKINTFFCRLHVLTNTTSHVLSVMLEHEKDITGNNDATVSTVETVIKKFAKKFSKRSSAMHTSACDWETYAHDKDLKNYKVDSFTGHRFLILYKIAVQIIYNKEHLIDFLKKYSGDDEVMLELKEALQNPMIVLHLTILSLFDVLICSPFMRFSENSNSVLDTRHVSIPLINYLQKLVDEPMTFFLGESPFDPFPASFPKETKGMEYESAIKMIPPIIGASEIISLLGSRLKIYFEQKLQSFITGDFAFPDDTLVKATAGAPSTNRAVESLFAVIDYLINNAPNMTTYNVLIKAIALKNKVYEYVLSLSEKEREELYQKVYSAMRLSAQLAADKKKEIQRELFQKMEQKALKAAKENSEKQRKMHKLASELEVCGFWRTVDALDKAIEGQRTKDIKAWVKTNIQYRKIVWTPKFEPKWLMQFSRKVNGSNHTFTCDELIDNLKVLINADPIRALNEEEEDEGL